MKETKKIPPISMLIYGKPGSGKSIFANTFPKACIFDFDGGHKNYEEAFPENHYVRGGSSMLAQLRTAIKQIVAGKFPYETLVIDSLTNVENSFINELKGNTTAGPIGDIYSVNQRQLFQNDWGKVTSSSVGLFSVLRNLPVNLVVITQIDTIKTEDGFKYMPNLIGKGKDEAGHFADFMGYMYAKSDEDNKVVYYLALSSTEDDDFVAKGRLTSGAIPPIKNPHYKKLAALISGDTNKLTFED